LLRPDELTFKAAHPIAVLLFPVVLSCKASDPIAVLLVPVVLRCKALPPAAKFPTPVAEELKFVVEPIEMFEETFPLPLLTNKPLIVPFEPDVEIEPVTPNDPVISADPVYGNVVSGAYEALKAFVANEAVVAKLELTALDALTANEAVVAKLELTAFKTYEAVTAFDAVPKSEPVNDVAVKDPEMFTVFAAKSPFISGVPEPDAMYNLLLSSVDVEGPAANPIAILFEELPENKHPALWPNAILLDPTDEETKALFPIAVL